MNEIVSQINTFFGSPRQVKCFKLEYHITPNDTMFLQKPHINVELHDNVICFIDPADNICKVRLSVSEVKSVNSFIVGVSLTSLDDEVYEILW